MAVDLLPIAGDALRHLQQPLDPIVAEVRAARAALLAAAGYDLEKLVERLRQEEARSGRPVVSFPPALLSP